MRRFLRDNGLSLALLAFFLAFWVGQAIAGWQVFNDEQAVHGNAPVSLLAYLGTSHFLEATAENWESEFLQMSAYVAFTAFLFQRGSAESKSPDRAEDVDKEGPATSDAPWPVRKGGLALALYRYSLSLAFALLFLGSFAIHAASGHRLENIRRAAHGQDPQPAIAYVSSSQFWFEAMQNWQSEFLAVLSIVVLS
ncbi:MAG: hypothetical protein JNL04_01500, partial [Rhodospirillaceae bacterium]|nr:hypothetical protein [Rhodospirillaceae bacterium]